MSKKGIKKEIISYSDFTKSLNIKDKLIIQEEEKKENREFYFRLIVFLIIVVFMSYLVTKSLKRKPDITNFIYSSV